MKKIDSYRLVFDDCSYDLTNVIRLVGIRYTQSIYYTLENEVNAKVLNACCNYAIPYLYSNIITILYNGKD